MLQNWILSASKMLLIQLAAHHFVREKFMLFCSNIAYFLSLQKHDLQKFSRNTFTIIAENNYNFLKYNFCCKNDRQLWLLHIVQYLHGTYLLSEAKDAGLKGVSTDWGNRGEIEYLQQVETMDQVSILTCLPIKSCVQSPNTETIK